MYSTACKPLGLVAPVLVNMEAITAAQRYHARACPELCPSRVVVAVVLVPMQTRVAASQSPATVLAPRSSKMAPSSEQPLRRASHRSRQPHSRRRRIDGAPSLRGTVP